MDRINKHQALLNLYDIQKAFYNLDYYFSDNPEEQKIIKSMESLGKELSRRIRFNEVSSS